MITPTHSHALALALVAAILGTAGCGHADSPDNTLGAGGSVPPAGSALAGTVTVDGSSTIYPVSRLVAEAFQKENPGVQVIVGTSGTGGGFKKFCAGQTDMTGASRPINAAESRDCDAHGIQFVELPVAFDSLSVVVNASNSFVDCLTVDELKKMWEPAAEGKVTRWNQIRSTFPDWPLALFGPGQDSGTFDYFTLAVVGKESSSRGDYTKSEDDTVLVNGVAGDPNALGYFGYGYYLTNKDRLKLVAINSGSGCVLPSMQSVAENRYQPLSRPMFIYASATATGRPEAKAFARFYVAPERARYALEIGYVPLPTVTLLGVARRLDKSTTGSVFGGRGSILGITADTFQDEDRIKSALVQ